MLQSHTLSDRIAIESIKWGKHQKLIDTLNLVAFARHGNDDEGHIKTYSWNLESI